MELMAVAAPAVNLFAGFLPALAALFGQPLPLLLAAAMTLACVSAEAAAPEATETIPVATTSGSLSITVPSVITNLSTDISQAVPDVWAKVAFFFHGPAASTTAITIAASSTLLDALWQGGQGNIHVALRGVGSAVAIAATGIRDGVKALVLYVVKVVSTGVVQVYKGVEAAVMGNSTGNKGQKKAAGQVTGGVKRGLASAFGFGPKPEENLSFLQTATVLRGFATNMGVWGKAAGLFALYVLAICFLETCDHGHGLVMFVGRLLNFVRSGLQPFIAVGQEFLREIGWTIAIILSIIVGLACITFALLSWIYGNTVCVDYLRGLAGRIYNGPNPVWAFVNVSVLAIAMMIGMVVCAPVFFLVAIERSYAWLAGLVAPGGRVLDLYYQVRRTARITRRHCREFIARPDLKSQELGGYIQAFCDLRAEIAGRFFRMTIYQSIEILKVATWDEVQKWMATTPSTEQLEVVEATAYYMRKVHMGKHRQTEAGQLLTTRACFNLMYLVCFDVLVRNVSSVSAVQIAQAKEYLSDCCASLRAMGGDFVGVAITLEGVVIAHDIAVKDSLNRQDWEKLRDSADELIKKYPTKYQRRAFVPIFDWADLVREQLLTVASQEVRGAGAVEKGLVGASNLMSDMALMFV